MVSHPNRGQGKRGRNPTPAEIRALRERYGLTVEAAAGLVYASPVKWRAWEDGTQRMHPAAWELFERKAGELPPPPA